jgi:hypothetical protein
VHIGDLVLSLEILRKLGKSNFDHAAIYAFRLRCVNSCACAIREAYAACLNVVILVNTVESETGV